MFDDQTIFEPEEIVVGRGGLAQGADITYIPMPTGFMYLVAIMDFRKDFVQRSGGDVAGDPPIVALNQLIEAERASATYSGKAA